MSKNNGILDIAFMTNLYSLSILKNNENILMFCDGNSDLFILDLKDLRLVN